MKQLFDVKQVEALDVFNPLYFVFSCPGSPPVNKCSNLNNCYKTFKPIHSTDTPESATAKWNRLCKFYSIAAVACATRMEEWKEVLNSIATQERYDTLLPQRSSSGFWTYAVRDSTLPGTKDLLNIVRKVLVTGQSSASAERAFSIMSRLKNSERSSLGDDTIAELIRIRFNGPDKIDEDSMYEYTNQFLKKHLRVDHQFSTGEQEPKVKEKDTSTAESFTRSRIFSSSGK